MGGFSRSIQTRHLYRSQQDSISKAQIQRNYMLEKARKRQDEERRKIHYQIDKSDIETDTISDSD